MELSRNWVSLMVKPPVVFPAGSVHKSTVTEVNADKK